MDKANLGQTVKVTGEIRASTIDSAYNQIEQIRALNDGAARVFDLEDVTTPPFNAKLVDPEYEITVAQWTSSKYHVPSGLLAHRRTRAKSVFAMSSAQPQQGQEKQRTPASCG